MARTKEIFVQLLMRLGLTRDTALVILGYAQRAQRLEFNMEELALSSNPPPHMYRFRYNNLIP